VKTSGELPVRGPYRIEDWEKTWLNPNKDRVLARVPAIAMPDISGYWPQTMRPVRGLQAYAKRIIDLLDFIPTSARNRSSTRPTLMSCSCAGSPEAPGLRDSLRLSVWTESLRPTGYVKENLILSDHPVIADFAGHVGDVRSSW